MAIRVAGELYESITGQLFEIGRQLRQPNGYPFDPQLLKVALQNAIEGNVGDVPKKKPEKKAPFFSILATTNLGAIAGKKTNECFTNRRRYARRDGDLCNGLPWDQSSADASVISTLAAVSKDWTFVEVACALPGVEQTTDIVQLSRSLIACGYTMTLAQAEEMVEATERDEKTGMLTHGGGNFFFIKTTDPKYRVSVGSVVRGARTWFAYVDWLVRVTCWSAADNRLLVRNLDASKLAL